MMAARTSNPHIALIERMLPWQLAKEMLMRPCMQRIELVLAVIAGH